MSYLSIYTIYTKYQKICLTNLILSYRYSPKFFDIWKK